MRIAFLGTPAAAVPALRALVGAGHDVAVVITRPDRRRGRGPDVVASPVKRAALDLGLRVEHSLSAIEGSEAERGVVVAYGAIIPSTLLDQVPMLNVHFSLLPRWRGAAPVERAILAGDYETGVCVMSLEPELDTGPIHLALRTDVAQKTASELTDELATMGATAIVQVLDSRDLLANPRAQSGEVTYAEKLTKESFHLQPRMTTQELSRTVRLGRAFTFIEQRRLRVDTVGLSRNSLRAGEVAMIDGDILMGCADGAVVLGRVQPEGSRPMSALAWWGGARFSSNAPRWT